MPALARHNSRAARFDAKSVYTETADTLKSFDAFCNSELHSIPEQEFLYVSPPL